MSSKPSFLQMYSQNYMRTPRLSRREQVGLAIYTGMLLPVLRRPKPDLREAGHLLRQLQEHGMDVEEMYRNALAGRHKDWPPVPSLKELLAMPGADKGQSQG